MALSYKLLWIEPIGVDGKTAYVMMCNDIDSEYRLATINSVPARYPPDMVLAWLQSTFSIAEGWAMARSLTGRELEWWLMLWKAESAMDAINDEIAKAQVGIAAAQQDIVDVNASALPAAAKTAIQHICNRQVVLLGAEIDQRRREKRIINTVIHLIRTRAPFVVEAPG